MPELRLELTPLIDVVFLLLTFFVFSMVLMVRAQVLDVELPALTAGRAGERTESITVAIDQSGGVFVDGRAVAVEDLPNAIEQRLEQAGAAIPVLIAVDAGGRAGRLIEVADVLTGAGITRFSVVGQPEDAAPTIRPADDEASS